MNGKTIRFVIPIKQFFEIFIIFQNDFVKIDDMEICVGVLSHEVLEKMYYKQILNKNKKTNNNIQTA